MARRSESLKPGAGGGAERGRREAGWVWCGSGADGKPWGWLSREERDLTGHLDCDSSDKKKSQRGQMPCS